jgi:hypothetical protein
LRRHLQHRVDQAPKPFVVVDRLAAARHLHRGRKPPRRHQVSAVEALPQLFEPRHADEVRLGRERGAVERTDGAADQEIGPDVTLEEGAQHADLHGTEVPAPAKDERGARTLATHPLAEPSHVSAPR